MVLAALLPLTILGAWQNLVSYRNARLLVTDQLRAKAWAIAENQRDPFIIARHALLFAAQQPAVRTMDSQCNEVLGSALQGAVGIVNFVRADSQGRARCSVLPFAPGTDMSRDRWWIETRGKPGVVVSTPQIGRISQRPVLIMVHNLQTPDGKFDGTISAAIDLKRLASSLQRKLASQSDALVIADSSGTPVLQMPAGKFRSLPAVAQAQTEPLEAIASDKSEWTFVSAPLFADQLFVVHAEPKRSVMAKQLASTSVVLWLQLLALLTTSLAIWVGSQRLILRWLAKLQKLTARFTKGDFTIEPDAFSAAPAELSLLADQLYDMAGEIDKHEKGLRAALLAQTGLTREVHHRVNNNLQIVTSLLSLQSDKTTDPWARNVIGVARARIGALGLIHRLLYRAGSGGEHGAINLVLLLADLSAHMRTVNCDRRHIALECVSADRMMSVDQAIPLTLFIVEAVTNAFRHAFRHGQPGTIQVELIIDENIALLTVRDDGEGFADTATNPGIGYDLMHAFAAQLGGTMELARGESGAAVLLRFPVTELES